MTATIHPAIPPSVANANAQLASADTPAGNARAMSARANDMLQTMRRADRPTTSAATDSQVVSADQLNDVDRALHEGKTAQPLATASADGRCAPRAGDGQHRRELHLGPDLPDRKNLHRLWRAADDGLGRTHVHGVGWHGHWRRRSTGAVQSRCVRD